MALAGLLIIDKPRGMTSHDVVSAVRRKLGMKKVGHAGTLDPEASGVLVLCVGFATKLLEYIVTDDKTYLGEVTFGIATDTDDVGGRIVATQDARALTHADVVAAAQLLRAQKMQRPPAYSAIHVDGRRAYALARAGENVDLPPRPVTIHRLDVKSFTPGGRAVAAFEVSCSKGTYVRALCRDWGGLLNVPAHLSMLRRTQSGPYRIEEAVPLEQWMDSTDPAAALRPPLEALRGFPQVQLAPELLRRLCLGQQVRATRATLQQVHAEFFRSNHEETDGQLVAVLGQGNTLAAVARLEPRVDGHWLKPLKVLQIV